MFRALFFLPLTALMSLSTQASARDYRACLAIEDVDQRVECLEGRSQPQPEAPSPLVTTPRFSPSFDCNKAASQTEILICSDSILSQLDAQMGQVYFRTLQSENNSKALIDDQRRWLSLRDGQCTLARSLARSCLIEITKGRIATLESAASISSMEPHNSSQSISPPPAPQPAPSPQLSEPSPPLGEKIEPKNEGALSSFAPGTPSPSNINGPTENDSRQIVGEGRASQQMIERIQSLLAASRTENVRFFRYVVEKSQLQSYKTDMPILRLVYDERVFFDTDRDVLRPDAMPVVKSISVILKQQTQNIALFVAGHTDARGTEQYNLDLSIRRAEGVARALKREGSGLALIWRVGFGKSIPIRPNTSEQNMALNRRVEFLIASQAEIITTWIKNTKGLCESETCGITSVVSNFQATPVGDPNGRAISIEIPNPKPVEIEMQFHQIEVGPPLR
jgi:outer membrane protein OmpA-like peptidoglycan-associated protein/uncharacterized protein YecT (DUF1311 family)